MCILDPQSITTLIDRRLVIVTALQGNDHVIVTNQQIARVKVIPSGRQKTSEEDARSLEVYLSFSILSISSPSKDKKNLQIRNATFPFTDDCFLFFSLSFSLSFRSVLYCLFIVSLRTTFQQSIHLPLSKIKSTRSKDGTEIFMIRLCRDYLTRSVASDFCLLLSFRPFDILTKG